MLCEVTLQKFDRFFPIIFKLGYFPFEWSLGSRILLPLAHNRRASTMFHIWVANMVVMGLKLGYVIVGFGKLHFEGGTLAQFIFHMIFFATMSCAFVQNWYLWKENKELVGLFKDCVQFSKSAQALYMPHLKDKYPLKDDKLGLNFTLAAVITMMFMMSIFFLSFSNPSASFFFSKELPLPKNPSFWIRATFSLLESHLFGFAWTSISVGCILPPNMGHLIGFWANELQLDSNLTTKVSTADSKLVSFPEIKRVYRILQLLEIKFNQSYSASITACLFIAMINLPSINYGTVKLYGTVPLQAWVACPYLTVAGAMNLFMIQDILSGPYEFSVRAIQSWRKHGNNNNGKGGGGGGGGRSRLGIASGVELRLQKQFVSSCPPLRIRRSGFDVIKKDTAMEYIDSAVDRTVTLLLWQ